MPAKLALMSMPVSPVQTVHGPNIFIETMVGGLMLAAIYVSWSKTPRPMAFWATELAHFLHNAFTFLLALKAGSRIVWN